MFQNQVCWPNQTPSPVLPVKILVVVPSPFPTYMFDPRKVFPDPIPDQFGLQTNLTSTSSSPPLLSPGGRLLALSPLVWCRVCSPSGAECPTSSSAFLSALFYQTRPQICKICSSFMEMIVPHGHLSVNFIHHLSQKVYTSAQHCSKRALFSLLFVLAV